MSEWSKYRLDQIASLSMGQSPESKFYNTNGKGLPFFQGKTEFGEYYPETRQFTSKVTRKAIKGDILFTVRAPVGELNIANQECCIGRGLASIQANKAQENKFLYYALKINAELFLSRSSGAVYDAINGADLKSTEILIPNDSHVRTKIAKILSNYDDLIENNLKRIKLLEESARLTYEEWFLYKRINSKVIPYSEITDTLLVEMIDHFMNGGWGKEHSDGKYINQAYVIRGTDIPDISQGNFSNVPYRFHTETNLKNRKLNIGDIAIEMSNGNIENVGRSIYFDSGINSIFSEGCICASFCKMIKPKSLELSYLIDSHLKYIQRTNEMLVYKSQAANGINNFRFEDMVNNEVISIPKGMNLKNLTEVFKIIYSEKSNLTLQIKHLKEARDILLPRLMTGMIDTDKLKVAA